MTLHPLVQELLAQGERPEEGTMAALRAQISDCTPSLLALLEDEAYWNQEGIGAGHGPLHAVTLLVEAGISEAIMPMIEALFRCDPDGDLYRQIVNQMGKMGEVIVEPALITMGMDVVTPARLAELHDESHVVKGLCSILSECGVKDERIFELLVHMTIQDPTRCHDLADYGDPRATHILSELLDAWSPSNALGAFVPTELKHAIELLGGTLTQAQEEKASRSTEEQKALFSRPQTAPPSNTKRKPNERCWCGSGKKYKKCHMR